LQNQVLELKYCMFVQKAPKRRRTIAWEKDDALVKTDSTFPPSSDAPKKRKLTSATPQLKAFFDSHLTSKQHVSNCSPQIKSQIFPKAENASTEVKNVDFGGQAVLEESSDRVDKLQLLETVKLETIEPVESDEQNDTTSENGIESAPSESEPMEKSAEPEEKQDDTKKEKITNEAGKTASPSKDGKEPTKQNGAAISPPIPASAKVPSSPASDKVPSPTNKAPHSIRSGKTANVKCYTMLDIPVDEAVRRKPPTPVEVPEDSPSVSKRPVAAHADPSTDRYAGILPFVKPDAIKQDSEMKIAPVAPELTPRMNRRKPIHPIHHASAVVAMETTMQQKFGSPESEPKTATPSMKASASATYPVQIAPCVQIPTASVDTSQSLLHGQNSVNSDLTSLASQRVAPAKSTYETVRISDQQHRGGQFILLTAHSGQNGGQVQRKNPAPAELRGVPPQPTARHLNPPREERPVQPSPKQNRSKPLAQNVRPSNGNPYQNMSYEAVHRVASEAVRKNMSMFLPLEKKSPQASRTILPKATPPKPPTRVTSIEGIPQVKRAAPTRNIFKNEKVTYPMGNFSSSPATSLASNANSILSRHPTIAPKPIPALQRVADARPLHPKQHGSYSELKSRLEQSGHAPYMPQNINGLIGKTPPRQPPSAPSASQAAKPFVPSPSKLHSPTAPPPAVRPSGTMPFLLAPNRNANNRHRPAILSHNPDRRALTHNAQRSARPENRSGGVGGPQRSVQSEVQRHPSIEARLSDALARKPSAHPARVLSVDPYQQTIERTKAYVRSLSQQPASSSPAANSTSVQKLPLSQSLAPFSASSSQSAISRTNLVNVLKRSAQRNSTPPIARDVQHGQRRDLTAPKTAQWPQPSHILDHTARKSAERPRSISSENRSISIFSPPAGTKSPWSSRGYPLLPPDEACHSEYTPPIKKVYLEPPRAHQPAEVIRIPPQACVAPGKHVQTQVPPPDVLPLELTSRTRKLSNASGSSSPAALPTTPSQSSAEQPLCLVKKKT